MKFNNNQLIGKVSNDLPSNPMNDVLSEFVQKIIEHLKSHYRFANGLGWISKNNPFSIERGDKFDPCIWGEICVPTSDEYLFSFFEMSENYADIVSNFRVSIGIEDLFKLGLLAKNSEYLNVLPIIEHEIKLRTKTKIVAIGDTHGHTKWKQIFEKEQDCNYFVFIGDYFDNKTIDIGQQIENYQNIINIEKTYPKFKGKIIRLCGNHDQQYLPKVGAQCDAFNPVTYFQINERLQRHILEDKIQLCFVINDLIFVHAGISEYWLKDKFFETNFNIKDLEQKLNNLLKYRPSIYNFSYYHPSGDDISECPLWIRPKSLDNGKIEGFTQIVGHTVHQKITWSSDEKLIFIDCLGTSGEYLTVYISNDNETFFEIKSLSNDC